MTPRSRPDHTAGHQRCRTELDGRGIAFRRWPPANGVGGTAAEPGSAPAVLVHGLVVSSRYHVPLADLLARRREVLAPDLPGFGDSDRPTGHPDTRELGTCLARWLDAEGRSGVTLVANSYGCQIVAHTVLARPDLVGRLVLLGPTMDPRGRRVGEQLRRWRLEAKTQSSALQLILARDHARAGPRRALATFRHALDDAVEEQLPYVPVPTLVVRGTRDPIVPQQWAQEATELLPHGHLRVLPGATHAVNHEQPQQTARVLERFLATS
jgi:2-hydroxy-6-oxonona-2,4-dienedioate hydrolase